MRAAKYLILILLTLVSSQIRTSAQDMDVEVSVLTCTRGDQIYSMYGHSGIRVKGVYQNQEIDWVYNYGTFEFDETFTWKFTRGQLNYMLSKQTYFNFELEYFHSNRGIREQTLNLEDERKELLVNALEENYKPENRYYLYDFFYDNCATRIRDMLQESLGDSLAFIPPNHVDRSYRQMIDEYHGQWPWTDFGIDLALGLPCDRDVGDQGDMFLPDYLYAQLGRATLDSRPLVSRDVEVLPQEVYEKPDPTFTPTLLIWIISALLIGLGLLGLKRPKLFEIMARSVLAIYGLGGLFILFLWIGTDHTATADNMNLLWAFPLHIIMAFASWRKNWQHSYFKFGFLLTLVLMVSWAMIPQDLHPAVLPLLLVFAFISGRIGLSPLREG